MKLFLTCLSGIGAIALAGSSLIAVTVTVPWPLDRDRAGAISEIEATRPRIHLVTLHPAPLVISPRAMIQPDAGFADGHAPALAPRWMRFAFATTVVRAWPLLATFAPIPFAPISSVASAATAPLFFPPEPPALGAPLPTRDAADPGKTPAPAELAAYVNESFYAPLAARLAAATPAARLTDALRAQLESYRATKLSLQTELRAKIDTLRDADAATREAQLAEFSRVQTPRIAALEATAEQLRRDLAAGLDFGGAPAFAAESDRLRFAAFFQEDLSPDQRRLLREAALQAARAETSAASVSEPWLCFSPESSRTHLPADLPADLTAKIATYRTEKSALKQELRSAVAATAAAAPAPHPSLADLATQQAARLAALETLADDIRRGVTLRKDPARAPDLPPISPELEARIATYRRDKLDLQKSLLTKVEEVTQSQAVASSGSVTDLQEKIRQAIAAYTRENAAHYASLETRKAAIRTDLARLPNPAAEPARAASADILLARFTEALHELEIWRNYRYYQIAVLQPGLSTEQRRLLFDSALEELALPLPGGTPLP